MRERVDSMATAIGASMSGRVGSMSEESLRARLMAAGHYTTPPGRLVGYQVLAAAVAGGLYILVGLREGRQPTARPVLRRRLRCS